MNDDDKTSSRSENMGTFNPQVSFNYYDILLKQKFNGVTMEQFEELQKKVSSIHIE